MGERTGDGGDVPHHSMLRDLLSSIPDTIRVGALVIEVRVIPGLHMLEDGRYGLYRSGSQRIEICGELAHGLMVQTLLHEIIHAISFERALSLKEREVDQIANGLLAFLLDNDVI